MSKVYFTADCHWGHKNIANFRPQFATAEEHHEAILNNILSTVRKRDSIWILGDICFDEASLHYLQTVADNVNVLRIIPGNHCVDSQFYAALRGNIRIMAFTQYKHCWISHCPIHPQEMRGRQLNIHGHLHGNVIRLENGEPDPRYLCVSLEHHNYKPVSWDEIKENSSFY